jgi:Cu-Zn family superoxide dismutase
MIMIRTVRRFLAVVSLVLPVALAGCSSHGDHHAAAGHRSARASMHPTEGSAVTGSVTFTEVGDGAIEVTAEISGLSPNGVHAIHIHEKGDCSAPDASSAGGHYNPDGHPHAGPDTDARHAGDLGNLTADADGRAWYRLVVHNITLDGHHNPVVGYGVIIHKGPDDFATQPTGNAGGRAACGVIEFTK